MSGEPNYHARILKGRLFRSMQLDGADFSGADVRGADFSNASLVGADFTNARIGVRPFTAFVILAVALVVSIAAGVAIGLLAETAREKATASDWRDVFGAVLLIATVLLFFGYLVVKGISQALRVFLRAVVIVIVVDFAIVFVLAGEVRFAHAFPIIILLVLLLPAATAGILGRIVGGTFGAWGIGFVAVIGGLAAGRTHGGAAAIVVSESPNPIPISITENVLFGIRSHSKKSEIPKARRQEMVEKALREVSLWDETKDDLSRKATTLTLEQQQKLCIARLLPLKPEIILMDEPCSALDADGIERIEALIAELKNRFTILMVTHNMAQARRASDECIFMLLGEIIEHNRTQDLFLAPQHEKTTMYIEGRYG